MQSPKAFRFNDTYPSVDIHPCIPGFYNGRDPGGTAGVVLDQNLLHPTQIDADRVVTAGTPNVVVTATFHGRTDPVFLTEQERLLHINWRQNVTFSF